MKYVINPDLVWSKAQAYSQLITFCGHLTCSGHPRVAMCLYSHSMEAIVFVHSFDELRGILEVSDKYLSLKWSVDADKPKGGEEGCCWVIFKYVFDD